MTQAIAYPPRWLRTIERYRQLVTVFKGWPRFLACKWGWLKGDLALETRSGLKVLVPEQARFEFKDVFLHRAYGFRPVLERLPGAPVILDIGANVGFFSLFAFLCRPDARCLAFEPLDANFRILQRQRESNPACRWELFPEAVMGRDGDVQICSQKAGQVDASALVAPGDAPPPPGGACPQRVKARSLPTILAAFGLSRCDWLKLDCEGSEFEILYQCPPEILQRTDSISVEIHDQDNSTRNATALCAYLAKHGFRLFQADDAVVHALR